MATAAVVKEQVLIGTGAALTIPQGAPKMRNEIATAPRLQRDASR